jgi:acetyltransferase
LIENSTELFPAAETLSSLPPIKNNRVAILADGGGHATIAADILTDLGVEIPELTGKTKERLKKILPFGASVRNPVDVAGGTDSDPTVFADCADIILKDPNVGGLLIVGLFGGYGIRFAEILALQEEDAAHRMGRILVKRNKPIVLHSLYSSAKPHSLHLLRYYNIPVYDSLDVACKCMGVLAEYGNYLNMYHTKANFVFNWGAKAKPEGRELIRKVLQEGRSALLEYESKRLLHLAGAAVAQEFLATTPEEAVRFAETVAGDVAMKISSPDILHKSDAGGVRLGLHSEENIRRAFNEIIANAKKFNPQAVIRGIHMAPMAAKGVEVIIGTKIDDQFGPVIMFGMGGVMVEIFKDVSFRVLPITRNSAKQMIEETRFAPILEGVRGQNRSDKNALIRLLLTCSDLIEAYPEIQEMDLNPVIVHENGVSIVDARIILKG